MRKTLLIPLAVCLVFALTTHAVHASDANRFYVETNKTSDFFGTVEMLPVEVIYVTDRLEIRKFYELGPEESPDLLPCEGFERGGYVYELGNILREAVQEKIQKNVTVAVRVESEKDDLASFCI